MPTIPARLHVVGHRQPVQPKRPADEGAPPRTTPDPFPPYGGLL